MDGQTEQPTNIHDPPQTPAASGAKIEIDMTSALSKQLHTWIFLSGWNAMQTGFTLHFIPTSFVCIYCTTYCQYMHMPGRYKHKLWGLYYFLRDMHGSDVCMSVQAQTGLAFFLVYAFMRIAWWSMCKQMREVQKWRSPSMSERQREGSSARPATWGHIGGRKRWMRCGVCMFVSRSQKGEDACVSDGCSLLNYSDVVKLLGSKNLRCSMWMWREKHAG